MIISININLVFLLINLNNKEIIKKEQISIMLSFDRPVHQKFKEGKNKKAKASFWKEIKLQFFTKLKTLQDALATINEIINVAAK